MFKKNNRFTDDNQFSYRANSQHQTVTTINKQPERDIDFNDQSSFVSGGSTLSKPVLDQIEDYLKIQAALTKKFQMIKNNIGISQQKNKLKDKQIQMMAQSIDKLIVKISDLESQLANRQKKLNKISVKCHDTTLNNAKQQQKIKKQSTVLSEEISRCQLLQRDINVLQEKFNNGCQELERCKQLYSNLDALEEENQSLRSRLSQLHNQEKMTNYMQNNQRLQCQELQHKLQQLKNIYKERSLINKRNMTRLNNLKKEISNSQDTQGLVSKKTEEIRRCELQLGQLNQQLLFCNQDVSQLEFKIRKKEQAMGGLRQKLKTSKYEPPSARRQNKIIQSQQEPERTQSHSLKTSKKNSNPKNSQELSVNSKSNSPHHRNRSNLTPTFPSNELQINMGSQQLRSVQEAPSEAFRNIEKLINRFEQIKNKDKSKHF